MDFLTALESSGLAATLRHSFWIYPLVNAAHVLGVALLVGAIVPMDVRILGAWSDVPVATLGPILLPFAVVGLCMALLSGALLFIVQPTDYAAQPLFWAKMLLVALGVANALMLRASRAWAEQFPACHRPPVPRVKIAAALSLLVWLATLFAGRMLGYL